MRKKNLPLESPPKNGKPVAPGAPKPGGPNGVFEALGRVNAGLGKQNSAVDAITLEATELARSLKDTATQAASVAHSSEESASSVNEIAASAEQVTANIAQVATSSTQTTVSVRQLSNSIQTVTATAQEMA